ALKEVAGMKEPFDLAKVKGYNPSYKKEHTKAGNDIAIATFPFLSEVVADPSAPIEALLSKKPHSLQRPTPTRTHEPSPYFGTGFPSVSINIEPPVVEAEPTDLTNLEQMVKNIADLGGSSVRQEKLVIHVGSVAGRIKDMKCRTKGSINPHVDAKLLDLHDRCYARQAAVNNTINRRARELLKVVDQIKGECEVLREREKARTKNVASLEAEKAKLEVTKASLHQEVETIKSDKEKVVSKVVPYVALELVHINELDPSAPIEALLSKKPHSLQRPTPTRTHVPAPSAPSQKATPSSA
nr:hypothetical protein [Tanacetum cinerariifolium]